MKRFLPFLPAFFGMVALSSSTLAGESNSRLIHAVLVVVNGQRITQQDLKDAAVVILKRRMPNHQTYNLSPEDNEALSDEALRELIKIQLIYDEARNEGVSLRVSEVDEKLRRLKIDPLRADPMERRFIESEMLFDKVMQQKGLPRPIVTPGEMQRFYREHIEVFTERRFVKVRHIYMDTTIDPPEKVNAIMTMIRDKIRSKPTHAERLEFFAEAAKEFSQDRFKSEGGLLRIGPDPEGWFPQEFTNKDKDGRPIFPEAMVRGIRGLLRSSPLTEVIRSDRGYHLLLLEDARGGEVKSYSEAQRLIERLLEGRKRDKRMNKWIKGKWDDSRVHWHDGDPYTLEQLLPEEKAEGKDGP